MVIKSGSLENDHACVHNWAKHIQPGSHVVLSSSDGCTMYHWKGDNSSWGHVTWKCYIYLKAICEVSLSSVMNGIKPLLKTSFDDDSDELSQLRTDINWMAYNNVHM